MGCWATPSVMSIQSIPLSTIITEPATNSKLGAKSYKLNTSTKKGRLTLSFSMHNSNVGSYGSIKSSRVVSQLRTEQQEGKWEEPDIDSDSDEEDEEVEDENLGFESDWEEEETKPSATTNFNTISADNYEEQAKKEVDRLLEPEERAILQQNLTPNLEKISTGKWSPLHTLALSMQISSMDKLLDNGLDIDLRDKEGHTALHKAIIGKKDVVISHLLRKGASPHVKDKDGATPLHYAVQVGAKEIVKLLIKNNVDVNATDNEGWTPLHIAIQSRNRDISKILLVNGADKTRKTKDGKTALDLSLCYGNGFKSYELAQVLKVIPADRDL